MVVSSSSIILSWETFTQFLPYSVSTLLLVRTLTVIDMIRVDVLAWGGEELAAIVPVTTRQWVIIGQVMEASGRTARVIALADLLRSC